MNVAILGCGPAGMLVAHAAAQSEVRFDILSLHKMSRIGGAQYLHRSIPGVTHSAPEGVVHFEKVGNRFVYAKKVYGHEEALTSWSDYERGRHEVWNMRKAYGELWRLYHDKIIPVDGLGLHSTEIWSLPYDVILSTIPAKALCLRRCTFTEQKVYISQDDAVIPDMTIVYDGTPDHSWYRQSKIFGVGSTEWPHPPEDRKFVTVRKPLTTDCDCQPEVFRFGRYGQWRKTVLIHHAYEEALEVLGKLTA